MPAADGSFGWRWLVNFSAAYPMRVGWRRLSTESAGVGEKRLWLTGLTMQQAICTDA